VLIVEAFVPNACFLAPVRSARRGLLRKLSRLDLNRPVQGLGYPGSLSPASMKQTIRPLEFIFFQELPSAIPG